MNKINRVQESNPLTGSGGAYLFNDMKSKIRNIRCILINENLKVKFNSRYVNEIFLRQLKNIIILFRGSRVSVSTSIVISVSSWL